MSAFAREYTAIFKATVSSSYLHDSTAIVTGFGVVVVELKKKVPGSATVLAYPRHIGDKPLSRLLSL